MKTFIGVDLGTSSVKLLLVDEKGKILNTVSGEYPLSFPHPGWSEQNPEDWMRETMAGIPKLLEGFCPEDVCGIGAGGQMHGLVVLDENDSVIRPAILWNDGRTARQTEWLNTEIGKEKLSELTANIAFAGFTAPKLLWMRENEPENFAKIAKIMLPKDYVNYMLTGVHCTDVSDASGMLLYDVKNGCWSEEMMKICGVKPSQMAKLFPSAAPVGTLKPDVAAKLGLRADVVVCAGAGDNAAAAVGTGTVGNGRCNVSVGTSGTVFISSEKFGVDPNNALHSFAHADGQFHLMGCMLSAASCNRWFVQDILKAEDFKTGESAVTDDMLGRNHVYFLPYLMGERSPHNDPAARATFTGMTMDSTRTDMIQAVLEGVAFGIRDSFEVAKALGLELKRTKICGGGAKSKLWKKIFANILNMDIDLIETEEGPGLGGAMLAMVACGVYPSVQAACDSIVKVVDTVHPDPEIAARYEAQYAKFRKIYPAMKSLFPELG